MIRTEIEVEATRVLNLSVIRIRKGNDLWLKNEARNINVE